MQQKIGRGTLCAPPIITKVYLPLIITKVKYLLMKIFLGLKFVSLLLYLEEEVAGGIVERLVAKLAGLALLHAADPSVKIFARKLLF